MNQIFQEKRSDAGAISPRYSLRDLGTAVVIVCLLLALTLQMGFVGFVFGGYLSGMLAGRQFPAIRAATWGCAAGLAVFLLTYFIAWRVAGTPARLESLRYQAVAEELREHTQDLQRLMQMEGRPVPVRELTNEAGLAWQLRRDPAGDESWYYLGEDRRPGGVGLDADVSLANFESVTATRVPLRQFLSWSRIDMITMIAFWASVFTTFTGCNFANAWPRMLGSKA